MSDKTIIDDSQDEEEAVEEPKGGGLLKLLLLLVPFTLLPASAGAYVAYSQYPNLARAAAVVGWDVSAPEEPEEEEPEEAFGHFASLNDLLINPAGTSGGSFLLVNLGLESRTPEVLPELEEKDIVIRDVVLKTLSEHTVAELSDIEMREGIKQELRAAINDLLDKGTIDRLYFTQYVLQ